MKQIILLLLLFLLGDAVEKKSGFYTRSIDWDEIEVGTGRIKRQTTLIDLPYDYSNANGGLVARLNDLGRAKRKIYGEDDRVRVDPATQGSEEPYNAIVRISTGCSGILVSEKHVLAASHCVHNGNYYLPSARLFLRVGYIQSDGKTKWTFVKRFFVPARWRNHTQTGQHEYSNWADYDFSVLELTKELGQTRNFIKPGLSGMFCNGRKSLQGRGSSVEYVSFPDDKPKDAMWLVKTKIETETKHLLYFKGDAWHGSSGAALYTWDYNKSTGKQERRVIGVLSGNRDTESEASIQGNYNVAVRLDPIDFLTVCKWIGTESECRSRYEDYLDQNNLKSVVCGNVM